MHDCIMLIVYLWYLSISGFFNCRLGMFFSPLIPFMTFVKCVLFFWVKKVRSISAFFYCMIARQFCLDWGNYCVIFYLQLAVLKINVPQERPFKTSGSNSLFMLVLLLSFIISAGLLGYMIGKYVKKNISCMRYLCPCFRLQIKIPYDLSVYSDLKLKLF